MLETEAMIDPGPDAIREAFNSDRSQMRLMLARKLKVREVDVIVSNGAATIEAFGTFGKFSNTEGFFNVRSKSLDMHIRTWELASIFAMRKPSHVDGREALNFQFFDRRGDAAFKVFLTFGGHDPAPELLDKYNGLIAKFEKSS